MGDVTVITGTYGDPSWIELAEQRAGMSVQAEGVPWIHVHAESLHDARNQALECVGTEWVIHLDADDELEPGYIDAMLAGSADVRAPMLNFRTGRRLQLWRPQVFGHRHDCTVECVTSGAGNWIAIGAMVRTDLVREAGGWRDWPVYEDFDLWMRVLLLGATAELVTGAVYRAHVRRGSRNRGPSSEVKNRTHWQIVEANLGPAAVPA